MTPALTPAVRSCGTLPSGTHPAETHPFGTLPSHEPQTRREHLEPVHPFLPVAAFGTAPKVRVERRAGHLRRQVLAVGAGGYGGTDVNAVHPAIVPGTGPAATTGGRRA
ncbi:hypothetical protein GCM10010214_43440 [Streptomyces abikoensis]|nr:hypothetical protein GCM10010214_43440 [Streptomyces abikoensis]